MTDHVIMLKANTLNNNDQAVISRSRQISLIFSIEDALYLISSRFM